MIRFLLDTFSPAFRWIAIIAAFFYMIYWLY